MANSKTKKQQIDSLLETSVLIPEYEGLSAIEVYSLITNGMLVDVLNTEKAECYSGLYQALKLKRNRRGIL